MDNLYDKMRARLGELQAILMETENPTREDEDKVMDLLVEGCGLLFIDIAESLNTIARKLPDRSE
jgi:hypothetical protein